MIKSSFLPSTAFNIPTFGQFLQPFGSDVHNINPINSDRFNPQEFSVEELMPKGFWTTAYIAAVVAINWLFVVVPMVPVLGTMFPPVMLIVGFVFVFRDFAQREIGHWVVVAMLVAGGISYFMSAPVVALASVTAFLISETIDWAVYTFTRKPLSQRILYSSLIAVPVDTVVFLQMVGFFDWLAVALVSAAKMLGALVFWLVLQTRENAGVAR
ncbi:MAG: hypothetical protein ABJL67_20680 [Sulfitobacter sp.]